MKVVLVILGFLAVAQCVPLSLNIDISKRGGDVLVEKNKDKTEEKPAKLPEVPATTEKPEEKTDKPEVKPKREATVVQKTDSSSDDPEGISIAQSTLDNKSKAPEAPVVAGRGTRATIQATNAQGHIAVASGKLENHGKEKGTLAQNTSAKGGKIAIATSSLTTTSESEASPLPAPLPEQPLPVHPVEPLPPVQPEVPAPIAPAPGQPEVTTVLPVEPVPASGGVSSQVVTPEGVTQHVTDPVTGDKTTQVIAKP